MPVEFQQRTLGNGLTIVAETDAGAHTASCGFFVRTGARDERSEVMGVSHFLEHMMFKGTERRSADDVNREFDEIGAQYNAYTSSEITCFYASTLPERFGRAADVLCDILRPALRDEDFDTEKGVILEEIAMYADNPFWKLYERAVEVHYADHPLAHRVLGTNDTIRALARDQMRAYFDDRYSADNTVVALAGAVDFDDACAQIEDLCGAWENTGAGRDTSAPPVTGESFEMRDPKVNRAYALMLAPGPGMRDERRHAAMMLARTLGDQNNSRLHWALIEPGIAEEAVAAFQAGDGCGDFYVYASGDPARIDEIWSIAERETDGLVDSLDESDLERLRNRLATGVTLAGERPSGRMQRLGRQFALLREYRSLEDELAQINAVTLDDLRAVASDFPFRNRTVGRLLPGEG